MSEVTEESFADTAQMIALNKRLRLACHAIRAAALAWIVLDFGLVLWVWADRPTMLDRLNKLYGLDLSGVSVLRYLGASAMPVVSLCAAAVFVFYLWRLVRVFLDGRVFTLDAAARMREMALAGCAAALVDVVVRPIGSAILSVELLSKVPFYHWFNPTDLLYLLIGGFVFALGTIFRSAAKMADDHARIV